jgi:hypothetical protein
MSDIASNHDILVTWIACHLGMEGFAGVAIDLGSKGPAFLLAGIVLALYVYDMTRKKDPRWYKILLLFVPVVAGVLLHEMFDDLAEHLFEKQNLSERSRSLLSVLVPCGILFVYAGLCVYLFPEVLKR